MMYPLMGVKDQTVRTIIQGLYQEIESLKTQLSKANESAVDSKKANLIAERAATAVVGKRITELRVSMTSPTIAIPNADHIVRNVLEGSGLFKPLEMSAPVVFLAKGENGAAFVGAGGIGGANSGVPTFGIQSKDGGFFFGPNDDVHAQMIFDPTSRVFQIGKEIVLIDSDGNPFSVGTVVDTANEAATNASSAMSSKLNKAAADTLSGAINVQNAGGFVAGTLAWDANGNRTGGYGVAMTQKGIVGYTSNGTPTFNISSTDGSATFSGTLDCGNGAVIRTPAFASANQVVDLIKLQLSSGATFGRLAQGSIQSTNNSAAGWEFNFQAAGDLAGSVMGAINTADNKGGRLMVASDGQAFRGKTTDGGASWGYVNMPVCDGTPQAGLYAEYASGAYRLWSGTGWVNTNTAVLRNQVNCEFSFDNGATWNQVMFR